MSNQLLNDSKIHEQSHIAIAEYLGAKVERAGIKGDGTGFCQLARQSLAPIDRACYLAAGEAGEAIERGDADSLPTTFTPAGRDDEQNLRGLHDKHFRGEPWPTFIGRVWRRAVKLLRAMPTRCRMVGDALMQHRTLTGDQIKAALRPTTAARRTSAVKSSSAAYSVTIRGSAWSWTAHGKRCNAADVPAAVRERVDARSKVGVTI